MANESSIDNFKSTIVSNKGFSRPHRFKVTITDIPGSSGGSKSLSILCESVSIPNINIGTSEYSLYRNKYKIPVDYSHDDVTISFYLTGNYLAKTTLDSWVNKIIDSSKYLLSYDSEYKRDVTIEQLDELDKTIFKVKLIAAFPISVDAIDLSHQDEDSISKVSATFTYSRIESENKNIF
jgi:hypothetical protein